MFPTRPDAQSFTKFLVTAGVFLIVAAFIVPGLILRETDVLKLPQSDLDKATPVGREELQRRQRVARDVGEATPWIFGGLLLGGVVLLGFGAPRLRKQEAGQALRSEVELEKLRSEIVQPQTEQEREEKLQGEVAQEVAEERRELATREADIASHGGGPSTPTKGFDQRLKERATQTRVLEERVLNRIEQLTIRPTYDFARRVRVEGAPPLLLDGVITTTATKRDVLVEIRVGIPTPESLPRRAREAEALRLLYRERVGHPAMVWLIIVDPESRGFPEEVRYELRGYEFAMGRVQIDLVSADEIDELSLPHNV